MVPSTRTGRFVLRFYIHSFARPEVPHQCMEGGDREDPQASQGGFGGTAGDG